jgi:para-nitrobenzyl esterase
MTDKTVEVATTVGIVRGIQREGSAAFLGVPFAEAPVGDLRFAAPVAHHGWDGVRDAVQYGATPQRTALSEVTLIPEPSIAGDSTLNLNVFTPSPGDVSAALPVLVYIHGGGFVAGSPASPWYDGAAFNRDGIVTVSVSYRLGFDGFGWIEDAPNNRGILDWVLALEWVRDNIAAFGGDPGRVTIAGQSAGGGAVLTLLAVPRAASLFHGVISLSAPESEVPLELAQRLGRSLAELGGVDPTRAGLSSLDESRVVELQNRVASMREWESGDNPIAGIVASATNGPTWAPVVDGDLVPEPLKDALSRGAGSDKTLLLGCTDNEFNMAVAGQGDVLDALDPKTALAAFGHSAEVAAGYVAGHPGLGTAALLGQMITDTVFRTHTRVVGEIRLAAGAPAWLYRFSWLSPTMGGAVHCLDVPFFFDCLAADRVSVIAGGNPPASLAADVHGAAVRFIQAGDPGWPAYDASAREVRVYDVPSRMLADGYRDVAALVPPE